MCKSAKFRLINYSPENPNRTLELRYLSTRHPIHAHWARLPGLPHTLGTRKMHARDRTELTLLEPPLDISDDKGHAGSAQRVSV